MKNSDHDNHENRVSSEVVEKAYVTLQEKVRIYRQARDQSNHAAGLNPGTDPVVILQDAVQTFFQFVRPFIKGDPRMAEYWQGAIAQHPDTQHRTVADAKAYYRDNSVGVWQIQTHTGSLPAATTQQQNGQQPAVADGGNINVAKISPGTWHEELRLPPTTRLLRIEPAFEDDEFEGWYYVEGRFATVGLREVPTWTVETRKERNSGDGFMAAETSSRKIQNPEPAKKVETAARMLVEVADELEAIATYKPRGKRVHGTPVPDE